MRCSARCRRLLRSIAAGAAAVMMVLGAPPAQGSFQQGLDAYLHGDYREALDHWRPAAQAGNAAAAFNVGVLYAQGLGVARDPAEAVRWYRRSAESGYANAQFNLGSAYYGGEGVAASVAEARVWWEQAAAQDHPEALYNLATLYRQGEGVERDLRRATTLFEQAASLGDARAQKALADLASESASSNAQASSAAAGSGVNDSAGAWEGAVSDDPPAAAADHQATAPAADAPAPEPAVPDQVAGAGPGALESEDPDHWTLQLFAAADRAAAEQFAAKHGLTGQLRIYQAGVDGKIWYKGIYGSFADRNEARAAGDELARKLPGSPPWIRRFSAVRAEARGGALRASAAAGGNAAGGGQTAVQSVAQPEPVAAEAQRDSQAAATTTAASTAGGGGGSTDGANRQALEQGQKAFDKQAYGEAMTLWRPLAEQGMPQAQYGVGLLYENGQGIQRDPEQAFTWYQRAAKQGHVKAQYNLGMLYRNGQGVAQNDALGLYWIQTAADRGDERATTYLKNLN